jgi:Tol biopolymer transport system component/predicted Ser/Thr protein kinase
MIGKTTSRYHIEEKLGGGGMGVVYRALDTVLGREVALKVISPELLTDQDAVNLFLREAKAASALNHPNILTVHDLVEAEGMKFIVMELVDGRTLRSRIPKKGMVLKELLGVAVEVADALSAAHRAGIVHRDLKPENIMVRTDGRAKVVDFGLAKLQSAQRKHAGLGSNESTLPLRECLAVPIEHSQLAGTLPYISPEQLQGNPADRRSDIFSFGVVLYEMATGQQPFGGRTIGEIMREIIEKDPQPITDLCPRAPSKLQEIAIKCMEKDPSERYQHMEDLLVDLRKMKRVTDSGKTLPPVVIARVSEQPAATFLKKSQLRVIIAGLVVFLSAVTLSVYLLTRPPKAGWARVGKLDTEIGQACLSPDGAHIAFDSDASGQSEIYVMLAKGGEPVQITKGHGDKSAPRFSPDGTQILYTIIGEPSEPTEVWKIPTLGGNAEKLVSNASCADWSPDGNEIAYAREADRETASIWICDSMGRNPRQIWKSRYETIGLVRWSPPDGRWLLCTPEEGPSLVSRDGNRVIKLPKEVDPSQDGAEWSRDGKYLFYASRINGIQNIWKASVPDGPPMQVTTGTGDDFDPLPLPHDSGLMYASGRSERGLWSSKPIGKEAEELLGGGLFSTPNLSHDGKWLAYLDVESEDSEAGALWTMEMESKNRSRISEGNDCFQAVWSRDGKHLAYSALVGPTGQKQYRLFVTKFPEVAPREITRGEFDDYVQDWGPGDKTILFSRAIAGKYSLDSVDLSTLVVTSIAEDFDGGSYSADGHWILALPTTGEPERKGIWLLPSSGGEGTKISSVDTPNAKWANNDETVIYSRSGRHSAAVELWRLQLRNHRVVDGPSLFTTFPASTGAKEEWDTSDDLSVIVFPRKVSQASFYRPISHD